MSSRALFSMMRLVLGAAGYKNVILHVGSFLFLECGEFEREVLWLDVEEEGRVRWLHCWGGKGCGRGERGKVRCFYVCKRMVSL